MIQNPDPSIKPFTLGATSGALITLPPGVNGTLFMPARLAEEDRTIQTIQVEDAGALEDYLAKQVVYPGTLVIFCDSKARRITAVLDYADTHESPGTNQHLAVLPLQFAAEFEPLFAVLNKQLSQEQFLNFLDENASLFEQCSTLKETVADFRAHAITKVVKQVNQRTGAGKLVVVTEDAVNEEINLPPAEVTAHVAIFPDQETIPLPVFIRYRPNAGQVGFTLVVPALEAIIRGEIQKIAVRLQEWLINKGWTAALFLRAATPQLTLPLPAAEWDLTGADLPEHLGLPLDNAA